MSKPKLIIRMIEDSPVPLDQSLVSAYLATQYHIAWPDEKGCFLTIGDVDAAFAAFLEAQHIYTFAIITASNPFSKILEDTENERRNLALEKDLKQHATLLIAAQNICPAASWPTEYGFCAVGISEEMAVGLGRKYEQFAVVLGSLPLPPPKEGVLRCL